MKKSKYRKWILLWGFLVLTGLLSICYTLYDSRMLGEVFDQVSPNSGYREMHDDSLYTVSFRSRTDTVQGIELFLEKMPAGNGKDKKSLYPKIIKKQPAGRSAVRKYRILKPHIFLWKKL